MKSLAIPSAWLAAALCLLSVAGFGAVLDGYAQARHPVALLGAHGMPHALAFNALAYVLPGLLAVLVALSLRARMDAAGWVPRVGAWLLLLSALAFAAQGLLPLDPAHLDDQASRWHAVAWTLWWIAFVAAAALLAIGPTGPGWHTLRLAAAVTGLLVLLFAALAPLGLPPAVGQRLALATWFAAVLVAAHAGPRRGPDQP